MTTIPLSDSINLTTFTDLPKKYKKHEVVSNNFLSLLHKIAPKTKSLEHTDFLDATQWFGINNSAVAHYPMRPVQCHNNCELLLFQQQAEEMYTGLALSEDGIWRPHSWCKSSKGHLIETTEPRIYYLYCAAPVKRQDRPKPNIGDGLTMITVVYYNHAKGRIRSTYASGNTVAETKKAVKEELIKYNHPIMAKQVDKAHTNCRADSFVHLVYEHDSDGDYVEWIMSYTQTCYITQVSYYHDEKTADNMSHPLFSYEQRMTVLKNVFNKLIERGKIIVYQFMFFDFCFYEDTMNSRFHFTPDIEKFTFTIKNGVLTLDFLPKIAPHFTERLMLMMSYFLPKMTKVSDDKYEISADFMTVDLFARMMSGPVQRVGGCPCCGE